MSRTTGRKYVNYRRRQQLFRTACMIISIFVLSITFALGASRLVSNAQNSSDVEYFKYYTSITVEPGTTLTSLAEEYGDHFKSNDEFIKEVAFTNHLIDDKLIAGMNLIVPYYSTEFKWWILSKAP